MSILKMYVILLFLISILIGFRMDNSWYQKSKYQPPGWVFGLVWPMLYSFLFVAYFRVRDKSFEKLLALTFAVQSLWLVSFNNRMLNLSRLLLILLVIIAFYLVKIAYKIDKWSGILVFFYLLWVSFATFLNFTITTN